jgi:hypothetical protein
VALSPEELSIRSDTAPNEVVTVEERSTTACVPFRAPRVGEKVQVRYRDKGTAKVADQVKILSQNQPPASKHLPPYPPTPEGVVQAFVKAGFDIKSIRELRETGDVDERLQYYAETYSPGYDCYDITLGYQIATIWEEATEAKVKVTYRNIGLICPQSLDLTTEKKEEITYRLIKTHELWRIGFPYGPPHISVATGIRLAEEQTFDSPEAKQQFQKNIMTLKGIHSTKRRETGR